MQNGNETGALFKSRWQHFSSGGRFENRSSLFTFRKNQKATKREIIQWTMEGIFLSNETNKVL
jgi:hypothetical protein